MLSALIRLGHDALREHCLSGDMVLDGTMGNGLDTAFLANLVGPNGLVIATDKQATALENTRERLRSTNLLPQVKLIMAEHCHMAETLRHQLPPGTTQPCLAAAVFNLGYLPGGDKSVVTTPPSTLIALNAAWSWLRTGGIIAVHCYTGHSGAQEEADEVCRWMALIPWAEAQVTACTQHNKAGNRETLYLVLKN